MTTMNYIGLDVHKKTISYCVKDVSGRIQQERKVGSTRRELDCWMKTLPQPWTVAILITFSRAILISCEILDGVLITEVVYSNVSTGRSSVVSLVQRSCAMIFSARLYRTAESVLPIPGGP